MVNIDPSWFYMGPGLITVISIGLAIFITVAIVWGIRAHRLRVSAGKEELVGKTAEVRTVMAPRGMVFVEGETWTAIAEEGRAEPGDEVIITRVDGLRLWVTKKK